MHKTTVASTFTALRIVLFAVMLAVAPMANAVDCPAYSSVESCVNLAIAEDREQESRYALIGTIAGIALLGVIVAVNASVADTESEGEEPDPAERTYEETDPVDKSSFVPSLFARGKKAIRGFTFAAPQSNGMNLRLDYQAKLDDGNASGILNTAIEWRF